MSSGIRNKRETEMVFKTINKKGGKMAKNVKEEKSASDTKLFAFLATFFSIIGFIIALIAKKENKYVMYYAKQSLVVFIASIIVWFFGWIFWQIPTIGWTIMQALNLIVFILWLISWIYALSGQMKPVPIVGKYAEKINL
jgi:uncharacterized membrane protein